MFLQAAFNLLVCCYALGDKEGMMAAFQRLLTVPGLAEAKALQVSPAGHSSCCSLHQSRWWLGECLCMSSG
jgi:hypothetical protein